MATTGIDIEHVVEIDTSVEATLPRTEFGTGLLLSTNVSLDGGGQNKCVRFDNAAAAGTFFGSTSSEAADAAVWFAADPQPKALYIGRWNSAVVNTTWETGEITRIVSDWASIDNGSLQFGDTVIQGIDFTGDTTYTDVRDTLQTAIAGQFTGATVTYANNQFIIDFGTTSDVGAVSAPRNESGVLIGTYIGSAGYLELDTSGGRYRPGGPSESIAEAVERCVALADSGAPVALLLASGFPTNETNTRTAKKAMRDVAQSGDYMFGMLDTSDSAKNSADTTSDIYLAENEGANKTLGVYSDDATKRADIAVMAKLSAQDFDQPQSIITLVPKELKGTNATIVTQQELNAVLGKNGSVYTRVDGRPTLLGGKTANGTWADSQWWITWLKNEMEVSIFNALRNSNRFTSAALTDVINSVMAKAIRSGGARPGGVVGESIKHDIRRVTGNHSFDGVLTTGYIAWIDNPLNQTSVDRGNRVSSFKIWIAPSDAIQSVEGTIVLASG